MSIRLDQTQQTSSYKGLIGWDAYTEALNTTTRPAVEIELFLKSHSIPQRNIKTQEIVTTRRFEPNSQRDISTSILTFGAPDLLQVELSGWLITPTTTDGSGNRYYAPKDLNGTALAMSNMTYADIINMYIEGAINKTIGGAWLRKDPDYFVSPYGNRYIRPIISSFDSQQDPLPKRQTFNMTLLLEK